jgi:hypothetical protein
MSTVKIKLSTSVAAMDTLNTDRIKREIDAKKVKRDTLAMQIQKALSK